MEDHAVRGCLAALAIQDAVAKLGDPGLQIRVGLNTGEVVVQAVENSIYQTYDAAGVNVHLANRMEQMADADSILITGDTYAAAKQVPLGMQAVRGISTPIEVFKLTGLPERAGQRRVPQRKAFDPADRTQRPVGRP